MADAVIKNRKKKWNDEAKWGLAFAMLPVIGFFLFTAGPFVFSIIASFTDWNSMGDHDFIAFDNYIELFGDWHFWKSLWNTFFYMIGIPIGMFWALFLALAFNRRMPGVKVFRVIYYIPVVSSIVAVSILWRWLYNGDYGLLNQFLSWAFNIKGPNWMNNEATVKPGITAMCVWKGVGYTSLLYLGGLQNLPQSYYEAAYVDGASPFTIFRKITWPLMRPITFFIIITGVIGGAQMIVEPQIMTDAGGPNYSAATIVFYIWEKAFSSADAKEYACAASWVLAIIIFAVTAIQFKFSPDNDNYLE
jgi:multiple sugar transport system permease protein